MDVCIVFNGYSASQCVLVRYFFLGGGGWMIVQEEQSRCNSQSFVHFQLILWQSVGLFCGSGGPGRVRAGGGGHFNTVVLVGSIQRNCSCFVSLFNGVGGCFCFSEWRNHNISLLFRDGKHIILMSRVTIWVILQLIYKDTHLIHTLGKDTHTCIVLESECSILRYIHKQDSKYDPPFPCTLLGTEPLD